ncbi:hypothetical protein K439DRAFT_1658004 [Ramaria rubella]|nr:hypothetical protein K439DRAFT_1658004 [Ramaria rubella]
MPIRRQFAPTPSGPAVTVTSIPSSTDGSLSIDPNVSGTISNIATPTFIVTNLPTTTATPSPSTTSTTQRNGGLSTGAIAGVILGIFAVFAAALVAVMIILYRGKKRTRKARYKPWSRGGHGPALQEVTSRPGSVNVPADMTSASLATVSPGVRRVGPPAPEPRQTCTPHAISPLVVPPFSPIPNPFMSSTSPLSPHSPAHTTSHSHSSSINSWRTSRTIPRVLSAKHSHQKPQYEDYHPPSPVAAAVSGYHDTSRISENPYASTLSCYSESVDGDMSVGTPPGLESLLAKNAHSLMRPSMVQRFDNLVFALSSPRNTDSLLPPGPSTSLRLNTAVPLGMSRLSRGDGLVTPGGRSIQISIENSTDASSMTTVPYDAFPLPPEGVGI